MPFDIVVARATSAIDPNLSAAVAPNRPQVAHPTGGPNRHTTFVPSESTTWSLGEKCPERINDVGITGRTDSHIHLHVQSKNKTLVSLGGPATEVNIDAYDGRVPKQTVGYQMVTDDVAWHDAKGQHYIGSREGDVVVRSHKADVVVQADEKTVQIVGGSAIDMSAVGNISITAHPSLRPEDKAWNQPFEGLIGEAGSNERVSKSLECAGFATAILGLYTSAKAAVKTTKDGESGWQEADAWEKAALMVEVGKFALDSQAIASSLWGSKTGEVKIHGENFVSIEGGMSVGIYGGASATLSSALSASMFGGTASVSSLTWTNLWSGIGTSVKSLRDVSIEGEHGAASMKGHKKVVVMSSTADVTVQGDTKVKISAVRESAYFHGAEMAFLGSGGGSGWGIKADGKKGELHLGKVASGVKTFNTPKFATKNKLFMKEGQMVVTIGTSVMTMEDSKIEYKTSGDVDFNIKGLVKVKGRKVLLG